MLLDRRRRAGAGIPAVLLPPALPLLSCVSDTLVAIVPLTDLVNAVKVSVRTLNRT